MSHFSFDCLMDLDVLYRFLATFEMVEMTDIVLPQIFWATAVSGCSVLYNNTMGMCKT